MQKYSASSVKSQAQTWVGLDVHKNTIAIAVADDEGVRSLGMIPNDLGRTPQDATQDWLASQLARLL